MKITAVSWFKIHGIDSNVWKTSGKYAATEMHNVGTCQNCDNYRKTIQP